MTKLHYQFSLSTIPLQTLSYGSLGAITLIILGFIFYPTCISSVDALETIDPELHITSADEPSPSSEPDYQSAINTNDSTLDESLISTINNDLSRATSTIAVTIDNDVTTNSPTTSNDGQFTYGSTSISVTTNNKTGYKLYLNANNNRNTLTNETNTNITNTINSLTTNTVGTNMTGNTWGYALSTTAINSSSTFSAVPTNSTQIAEQASANTSGQTFTYNLGFGAHTDSSLPAGNYTNTVTISALANPLPPDISDISTMQSMTSDICSNMTLGQQYQLKDSRDNKTYYVAKLKDNHCWMTQNLAYDFVKGKTLTPSDSDVVTNWTIPDSAKTIGGTASSSDDSADMWKGTQVTTDHSSYGNYYSWGATTANSGASITSGTAPSSICPKGWRLPTKEEATTLKDGLVSATIMASPFYFLKAGMVNPNSSPTTLQNLDTNGAYWTSTASNSTAGTTLYLGGTNINVMGYSRRFGYSVRCLAK